MPPMTASRRGDVVLVDFVFSNVSGWKLLQAVVISTPAYHRIRQEVIVAAITNTITRRWRGEYAIIHWQED